MVAPSPANPVAGPTSGSPDGKGMTDGERRMSIGRCVVASDTAQDHERPDLHDLPHPLLRRGVLTCSAHAVRGPPMCEHDRRVRRAVAAGACARVQLELQVRAGIAANERPLQN